MMIMIGIDLLKANRISGFDSEKLKKIFTEKEIAYANAKNSTAIK